jgi:threonine synthase
MGENLKYKLKCVSCAKEYPADPKAMTCPNCGDFFGTLDVIYPLADIKAPYERLQSMQPDVSVYESFAEIFPYECVADLPPLNVGQTGLIQSPNLGSLTGIENLWLKDDGRNPSASFKDRASAVAIAMAREANAPVIAAASTGNAASSLATLAASVSLKTVVFVPKNAPRPKLTQIMIHGAEVVCLDCDYDHAFDLCQQACRKFGWYNRNTAVNPFTGEGKKSAALEIARDLGHAPQAVVCSVGDGCIISGLYKGFLDLLGLGLIDKLPRLYGVQAKGANPLVRAFESNSPIAPLAECNTIADSISVGYPRDGVKALRAVKNSLGAMISVSDDEILAAQKTLANKAGVFSEPAASASFAGLLKLIDYGNIIIDEEVVVLLTGHGLKDIDTAAKNITNKIEIIAPTIEAVSDKVKKIL